MSTVYGYGGWAGRLLDGPQRIFKKGLTMARSSWSLGKVRSSKKGVYLLTGGPYDGHKMPLTDGTTMKFTVTVTSRGLTATYRGCYRCGLMAAGSGRGVAKWVPND